MNQRLNDPRKASKGRKEGELGTGRSLGLPRPSSSHERTYRGVAHSMPTGCDKSDLIMQPTQPRTVPAYNTIFLTDPEERRSSGHVLLRS